jgi:hypothetical protein
MRHVHWLWLPVAAVSTPVLATTYLSVEQAQRLMFPGARLAEAPVALSDADAAAVARAAGTVVPHREFRVWRADGGGFFVLDEVVGKHELITYAVALAADGTVRQVEILAYREAYGYEIRNERWRRQFVGQHPGAPLRIDREIQNISGATLSCTHLTEGVARILALYDVALRH